MKRLLLFIILLIGSVANFEEVLDYLDRNQPIAENYESSIQDQATEVVPINIIPIIGAAQLTMPADTYNKRYSYLFYPCLTVRDKKCPAL